MHNKNKHSSHGTLIWFNVDTKKIWIISIIYLKWH